MQTAQYTPTMVDSFLDDADVPPEGGAMGDTMTGPDLDRLKGMKVLLAEDNVTNQLVATQMLEALGAEVDVAADGAIALELLKDAAYDVLLVDIEMPRVSGLDVIRSVRDSAEPLASAPIVALTAYAMQEHREKISRAGADGLIPKPIISIEQFGLDILGYMDDGLAARGTHAAKMTNDAHSASIDQSVYDSLELSMGAETMRDLLGKVESDLISIRDQITTARETGDTDQMRSATHVLMSVAGAIGGITLQSQAEQLNGLAHKGAFSEMRALAADALDELELVLEFVAHKLSEPTSR
ncbi:MAG: response regulator [Pikeienuella sp.]